MDVAFCPWVHGESKFVIMFGGMHIESAALETVGNLLESSGWTGALVQACVPTSGKADSFLKAAHITRTRRAHQVTACFLHQALAEAHQEHVKTTEPNTEPLESGILVHSSAGKPTNVQIMVPCPAAAAHHTRVCPINPV